MGENGLSPDIDVGLGAASRQAVMQSISTKGVASVVAEHDRPHLNEAALVAGSNPEVDELQQEHYDLLVTDNEIGPGVDVVSPPNSVTPNSA